MKDHTTTPTAELLAEWGKLETKIADRKRFMMVNKSEQDDIDYFETHLAQRNAIAAELDRRSEGIYVGEDGFPYFGDFKFEGKNGTKEPKHDAQWVAPTIPIVELRDLLTWLLMKGGNG